MKVGLHQGSAISPLLFIIIMDLRASEIDKEPPWAMLFAVLCETSKAAVERELEIWRNQFERHGLRVSRTKTAYIYMPCNDYDNNSRNYEEIQLGDDKLNTVLTTFKYLGSIFDSNGGAERDINNRVKPAWMKWKQLTGVLCDKKVPIRVLVRKKDENRLHVAEMRML